MHLLQYSHLIALPFLGTLALTILLREIALYCGLVDRPDQRKTHSGNIPLVGGPAMFLSIATSIFLLAPQIQTNTFLLLCAFMVILGVLDDYIGLRASLRIVTQASIAAVMAIYAFVVIVSVGDLVGSGPVLMHGLAGLLFTIICTIGVINAINMIDGVDGLAGTILLISFSAMCYLALSNGDWANAKLLVIFIGSILGFLMFNARIFILQAKIFMGDSGSMLLGLILVWFLITLTQGENSSISPVVAGWLFGLPLIDTVSVMVGRLRSRRHIFEAGRDHFHHKLLDSGLTVNQTVIAAGFVHAIFVSIGIKANNFPELEPILFWGFVVSVVLHHFCTPILLSFISRNIKSSVP